jgi:hypothetical protein
MIDFKNIQDSIVIHKRKLQSKKKQKSKPKKRSYQGGKTKKTPKKPKKHPLYHQKTQPPQFSHTNIEKAIPGKPFKKLNCSPIIESNRATSSTCYTKTHLFNIRDEYNKNHPANTHILGDDPVYIWNQLKNRLTCASEDCWLKEIKDESLRNQIDNLVFAPDSPPEWNANPNEWLSNFDILDVLSQYEKAYSNFHFIGPTPIDFDTRLKKRNYMCVENSLCHFELSREIENKKNKIGIIFNLDKHNQKGSHWVSMFIDLEYNFIFYFDSTGDRIPKEINALKNRIIKQAKMLSSPLKLDYKDSFNVHHQMKNTECGVYSLFFIVTMLTGDCKCENLSGHYKFKNRNKMEFDDKMDLFQKGRIPDKYIEKYRKIYFNN